MREKPFSIPKSLVWRAYKLIKKNGGAFGVDRQSISDFDKNLRTNLYKIWNRLASGSYFPPPVMAVEIPKKNGGSRTLGIPTVSDRIAQMAIKLTMEPILEPVFDKDSFGYRPGRSAHHAISVTRQRCWKYDWVLEFDIKGLFDNIPHDLLMKALKHHVKNPWVLLYVQRWLVAPMSKNGVIVGRDKGTPQGGVISPLLANLFLHYVFDSWMRRNHAGVEFCRYADDGLCHLKTEEQAIELLDKVKNRFKDCGLEIHPDKTKIIYCKTGKRKVDYKNISFDFLGFTFMPREARDKTGKKFLSFLPGVSKKALKEMRQKVRHWKLQFLSSYSIEYLSKVFGPIIRGWYNYYAKYYKTGLYNLWRSINSHLAKCLRRKYKKLAGRKVQSIKLLEKIASNKENLFVHWQHGYRSAWG